MVYLVPDDDDDDEPRILEVSGLNDGLFVDEELLTDEDELDPEGVAVDVVVEEDDEDDVGATVGLVLVTVNLSPPKLPCFIAN